jgi:two-component system sensor histidine kinase AgrC
VLDYIRILLNTILAISLMYMLLDCNFKNKKNLYLLVLFEVVVLICDILILQNFGFTYFMKLFSLFVHFPVFLAFLYISEFKLIKVFFVNLTVIAIISSCSLVGFIFSYLLGYNRIFVNVVCYILYPTIWFVIYKYLLHSFLYMLRNEDKGWFGFCFIPLSYTALIYLISKYNLNTVKFETKSFVSAILLFVLFISAYFQIFRSFKQTREQLIMQNEHNLLRTQVAAAQMHLEALKESQEKTIIYRHDMRHHLALIGAKLADNNRESAQKYISDMEENIEDATVEKYCSNYTVNLIIYYYIMMAKNEEITVETQINLPNKNAVSDMDFCIIFANAIENATNACKCIPSTKDRILKIVCKPKNDQIFIQITNSNADAVMFAGDMPISTKENHGLGTKSIAAVVKKYGGVCSFTSEDGVFKTSIIL